eukprot:TRINITY_DN1700_c0_g1_i2.p1 TRINITY_DN1700_c0_g1~~TRINITY_DN1700_c0_g1_i2.p1  ORF type:complete len:219 (-),score=25.42 TRINITY_DN1700_c0_g1_i2:246-902(-)
MKALLGFLFLLLTLTSGQTHTATAIEEDLCMEVNKYRVENGLAEVPLSTALMYVAHTHAKDLSDNAGTILAGECNMHSWSMSSSWTGCCYTPDHAQSNCMWQKPKELTSSWGANQYTSNGYENAASGSCSTGSCFLNIWKGSVPHNNVILNRDIWTSRNPWPAMGCGVSGRYAVLWFGDGSPKQVYVIGGDATGTSGSSTSYPLPAAVIFSLIAILMF